MGTFNQCGHTQKHSIMRFIAADAQSRLSSQRGIALVLALIFSLTVMALAAGVLYFVSESSKMASAGKLYATASQAADGAINLTKDLITKTIRADDTLIDLIAATGLSDPANCLTHAILGVNADPCALQVVMGPYLTTTQLTYLYRLPKGSIEFANQSGVSSVETFYKIQVSSTGPDNSAAEDSVLYRYNQ